MITKARKFLSEELPIRLGMVGPSPKHALRPGLTSYWVLGLQCYQCFQWGWIEGNSRRISNLVMVVP